MVSIPDWSKFGKLHENVKEPTNLLLNKYYKQREEQAIRQAEERGYFRVPTQEYLIEESKKRNDYKYKDVSHLKLIKLCGVHLRKVGEISSCLYLRICIINNNFLTKIDGLMSCHHLVKLDVHSNQLSEIPGIPFWSGMRKLEMLFLHDNPLGKYETLQSLATCPNLIALTLYDTPLSLKKNYRHHVANSIWTLKALDHYVVSDEEIIEDAVFGGQFGTLNPAFRINLCPPTPENTTYEEERHVFMLVIATINDIQAHHSPVLIIQRFIRGFLTRKRLGHTIKKPKTASGLQLPNINQESHIPPPPSSSPDLSHAILQDSSYTNLELDLFPRTRPESAAPSESLTTTNSFIREPPMSPSDALTPVPQDADVPKKRKNLLINLAKLQSGTFSTLYDEAIAIETILPDSSYDKIGSARLETRRSRRRKKKEPQRRIVKSVKQFFGPVVESEKIEDVAAEVPGEEIPITEYRLRGMKPEISFIDATTEMILEKQEAGRLIRDAEDVIHIRARDAPKPKVTPRKAVTTDQRIFSRVHGTMGISSLLAVHQAYKDREKAEQAAAKMEHILNLRDERDRAKERIRLFQDEKRNQALKKRDQEKARMLDALEQREMKRLSYLDRRQDFKAKSSDMTRSVKADFTFITEFSNQHTSVSNALMRHDKQAKQEDMFNQKSEVVMGHRSTKVEQQDVVKKYLEHRQLMRQTESAMAKNALDARMLQEANDRLMEAKQRVAQQKARRETVQAFYPLPQTVNPAPATPNTRNLPPPTAQSLPTTPAAGASHFEANVIVSQGRLGKHPTLVT